MNYQADAEKAINKAYPLLHGETLPSDIEEQYEALLEAMNELWTHHEPSVDDATRDEARFLFSNLNARVATLEPLVIQRLVRSK